MGATVLRFLTDQFPVDEDTMLSIYGARRPIFKMLAPLAGRLTFRLPAPLLDSPASRPDYPLASRHAVPRCNVCLEVSVAVTLSLKIHSGYSEFSLHFNQKLCLAVVT